MATHALTTGAPTCAPIYRPDAINSAPLLASIERRLASTGMAPSRFGRSAVGDPCLVRDLRSGRRITRRREAKIRAFLKEGR